MFIGSLQIGGRLLFVKICFDWEIPMMKGKKDSSNCESNVIKSHSRGRKMIKIEHLVKNYGTTCAVDDISFAVEEGEIVGLLGPNGAGKSTTMNILTGYLSSTSGKACIAGVDILSDPIGAKKLIGYLPEQPPLYLDMTVWEYLNFAYDLKGCKLPTPFLVTDMHAMTIS